MPKVVLLANFSEEYFKKILLGIARYSKENGPWVFCRMPFYYRDTIGIEGIMKWANEWGANGMFAQLNNTDDRPGLAEAGFPVIVTDLKERFSHVPNITGAYFKTGEIGAKYFIDKGYSNFAYYGYKSFVWSRERGEGYSAYLKNKNFNVHVFESESDPNHEMWYYKPSALSKWLNELPKPVAIMACDDNCAQQITESCKISGIKVPEEVAVLGVDNDELMCTLSDPQLSSIELAAEQGGYEAAAMLDQLMKGHNKRQDIVVQPLKIITRQSTDMYATADPQIAKALKIIHRDFHMNLQVNDIVRQIALSRRSFETKFRQTTRLSVYQYILKLRMEKFANMLIETNLPIGEIAYGLGMDDLKNVSRKFKQINGFSPGEYRKKMK
jgi:LacI family transcriptional regulator